MKGLGGGEGLELVCIIIKDCFIFFKKIKIKN